MPLLSRIRSRLSYANVMASIAVFIALGGSSYAAIKITGRNVVDGSLTGRDIKNRSVGVVDLGRGAIKSLKGSKGEGGERGPQGPQGPAGPQGPSGEAAAAKLTIRKAFVNVPKDAIGGATIACESGEKATGGGAKWRISPDAGPIVSSVPEPATGEPTGWTVRLRNDDDSADHEADVFVVCAASG